MAVEKEYPGHPDLTGGEETNLHKHPGGGGVNVKSGTISATSGANSHTFNSAFSSTPRVVLTVQDNIALRDCLFKITAVSTSGFSFEVDVTATYSWIATDAGDP